MSIARESLVGPSLTLGRLARFGLARTYRDVPERAAYHAQLAAKGMPVRRFALLFTPRSGSSRITDLATQTGGLGYPGELFNPRFTPKIARHYGARSREELVRLTLLDRQVDGIFSCKVTYAHLLETFGGPRRFFAEVAPDACIWLIREDILGQALSLARMRQTGYAHSTEVKAGAEAAAPITYDAAAIRHALRVLRHLERRTEAIFAARRLTPLRLSYEQTIAMPEAALLGRIAAHVGIPAPETTGIESRLQKLADDKSLSFAERFRAEHGRWLARLEAARQPMLDRLHQDNT
ncbi:Stf0 family sulfotransferase [Pseudoroseicyclus tamaricis]|uniref:Stf0 family sulfotransferase n=1 Tax=Pseudoroseicyclus tamaricis TaxID=2705421 RepID=UPI001432DC10|nr:Stf0 family sulfotransferase [Pseudoroseicyclus tamaricis]